MKIGKILVCAAWLALGCTAGISQEFSNKLEPAGEPDLNAPSGVENQGVGGALLGDATLFAVINSDGTRALGKGERSAQKIDTGAYEVIFWRKVSSCAFIPAIANNTFSVTHGFIDAVRRGSNTSGVYVETRDQSGVLADRAFTLLVIC